MRKKLTAALLAAALLVCVAGCHTSDAGTQKTDPSHTSIQMGGTHTDQEGVEIQIANAIWSEDRLTLEVNWINDTAYDVIYGAYYTVERKDGSEWADCAVADVSFIEIAYELAPGKVNRESYTISDFFDLSEAGTYRFKTECFVRTGADTQDRVFLWAEFEIGREEHDVLPVEYVYGVQYIRTNGYQDGAQFPRTVIIRSVEELNRYYETNKDTFDLERRKTVYSDTSIGFLDACDAYDEAYFETGCLVFILLEEGSGSVRHEVTGTTLSADGRLTVNMERISPEIGTCDMAEWHIILEISSLVDITDVQVSWNGRQTLGVEDKAVTKQEQPPEVQLLHPDGSSPVHLAGYSWIYTAGDGATGAVVADHAHPLLCRDLLDPISVAGTLVKLDFEEMPDSIEVKCWPDSAWNKTDIPSETVNVYGTAFDAKPGGYIYEITATWGNDSSSGHGMASYYVYIIAG